MRHRAGQIDPASIECALNETSSPPPFQPASDRAAWEVVCEAVGQERVSELLARAEADARAEIPGLPATLYLEFSRAGSREGYQGPANRRREILWTWPSPSASRGKAASWTRCWT